MSQPDTRPDGVAVPHDLVAERAVIGTVLLENNALPPLLKLGLSSGHFYRDAHGTVWEALVELHEAGEPIDTITLADCLRSAGKLARVGGDEVLIGFTDVIPTIANATAHARIVLEKATRRQLIATFRNGVHAAWSGEIEDAHEAARQALDVKPEKRVAVYSLRDVIQASVDSATCARRGSIRTGFHLLDKVMDPLAPGECMVVAGKSGCGKSHTAFQIALRAALVGHTVGMVSVEDPKRRWGGRAGAALHPQLTTRLLNSSQLNFEQNERLRIAYAKAETLKFHYADAHRLGLSGVIDAMEALLDLGCELIVVDHLHAIVLETQKGETPANATNRAVNEIKGRTQARGAALLLVAQVGKDKQGRAFAEPTMADLRESSQIEIAADYALLSWKPSDVSGAPIYGKIAKVKDGDERTRYRMVFAENGALWDLEAYSPPEEEPASYGGKAFKSRSNGRATT